MKNADLKEAIAALTVTGRTKIPMAVALRMAKLRQSLEEHHRAVEITRTDLVARIKGDAKDLDDSHPGWAEFVDGFNELMGQEYECDVRFILYVREGKDGPEYAWSENFKTGRIAEIEPNVLYGLMSFTDIVDRSTPTEEPGAE